MNLHESLEDAAPYNLYVQRLPEHVQEAPRRVLWRLADQLGAAAPRTVSAAVAVPQRGWQVRTPASLDLYAFGTFRSPVRTVWLLAEVLAELYLDTGILPVIRPITTSIWRSELEARAQAFERIHRNGVLAYLRGGRGR